MGQQLIVFLLTLASIIAAILPMVAFVAIIWWLDRYDREPVWMVALTFLWGALGGAGLSLLGNTGIQYIISALLGASEAAWMGPVIVAPLVEEPTKAVILLLVATSRYFDNTTDGFVYGAAAGLGFGMTANMLSFYQSAQMASIDVDQGLQSWIGTVVIRTFYSAVMHATATAIIGAGIGWSRFRGIPAKIVAIPLGILVAMGIHALWNGLLVRGEDFFPNQDPFLINLSVLPIEVLITFAFFQLCLLSEKRTLLTELQEEADAGRLPEEHVAPLSSYIGRQTTRFLPDPLTQRAYIRTATNLAFRKHQSRHSPRQHATFYQGEVERLRRELEGLLATKAQ